MDAIEKAKELVQDAYYDERGMQDVMRQDAAIWAQIAQAEQMKRLADVLELVASKLVPPTLDYKAMGINPEELEL